MKPALFLTVLLIFLLSGCQVQTARPITTPGIDVSEDSKPLTLPSQAQTLTINPKHSQIDIFVFRSGRLAHLGHNHVITTRDLKGKIYVYPELSKTNIELAFPVTTLIIDDTEIRNLYGKDFNKIVTPTE